VLLGAEALDDAGVYLLSDDLALVQSIDFFTAVVDDPFAFGQIAAANSLSDLYAMGADPITALNIIAFPEFGELGLDVLSEILRGGYDKCAEANVPIIGGHSIDDKEPKYGLAVTGTANPNRLWKKSGAQPGDSLVLTKPLGTGILATAIKGGMASEDEIQSVIKTAGALNRSAMEAAKDFDIHAATDVTGFGLINHLVEICRHSGVGALVSMETIPVLGGVREFIGQGIIPGGTTANLAFAEASLIVEPGVTEDEKIIACDAQTNGGLLLCLPQDQAEDLIQSLRERGTLAWATIGTIVPSDPPIVRLNR